MEWAFGRDPAIPYSGWSCQVCTAADFHSRADMEVPWERREHVESGAAQHVMGTGHPVVVTHAQAQLYTPMACELPQHPALECGLSDQEQDDWNDITRRLQ